MSLLKQTVLKSMIHLWLHNCMNKIVKHSRLLLKCIHTNQLLLFTITFYRKFQTDHVLWGWKVNKSTRINISKIRSSKKGILTFILTINWSSFYIFTSTNIIPNYCITHSVAVNWLDCGAIMIKIKKCKWQDWCRT